MNRRVSELSSYGDYHAPPKYFALGAGDHRAKLSGVVSMDGDRHSEKKGTDAGTLRMRALA